MSEIEINSMLDTIDDIKTNKLKFNLLISGKECRTLEEVKENFNIDDIKKYYDSDLLERWLLNNDYKDLCYAIQALKSKVYIHYMPAYVLSHINIKQELKDIFFPEYKKMKLILHLYLLHQIIKTTIIIMIIKIILQKMSIFIIIKR